MVWLKMPGDIDLLINDLRTQVYHRPDAFEQLGVRLAGKRLIVVKSLFHFYGPFSAIASEVIFCATPGRVNPNTGLMPFTRRDMNFWPRVDDPFAGHQDLLAVGVLGASFVSGRRKLASK